MLQDGDTDGGMLMGRLPTKDEAEVIRSRLGILKKREVGELELERPVLEAETSRRRLVT